mgnify:CR=1 FL=1
MCIGLELQFMMSFFCVDVASLLIIILERLFLTMCRLISSVIPEMKKIVILFKFCYFAIVKFAKFKFRLSLDYQNTCIPMEAYIIGI